METIEQKIEKLEQKINLVYVSVEKTRKYFLWTIIGTIALFVLPLIILVFVLPSFLDTYLSSMQDFGL